MRHIKLWLDMFRTQKRLTELNAKIDRAEARINVLSQSRSNSAAVVPGTYTLGSDESPAEWISEPRGTL